MKHMSLLALFALAGACAGSSGSSGGANSGIPKALAAQERFSRLVELLRVAGVDSELAAGGPYTIFAPTNAAFKALDEAKLKEGLEVRNRDKLRAVLLYHVVPGNLTKSFLEETTTVRTLEGHELTVETASGRLLVGEALITEANIVAENGMIHAIDSVIEPPPGYLEEAGGSETTGKKEGPDAWWW